MTLPARLAPMGRLALQALQARLVLRARRAPRVTLATMARRVRKVIPVICLGVIQFVFVRRRISISVPHWKPATRLTVLCWLLVIVSCVTDRLRPHKMVCMRLRFQAQLRVLRIGLPVTRPPTGWFSFKKVALMLTGHLSARMTVAAM